MKNFVVLVFVLVFPFLFVCCAPKQMYRIQVHEAIEDTEFEGMYGEERTKDLPETGIVVANETEKDISMTLEGKIIKTLFVLSGSTLNTALEPGTYKYTFSAEEDKQTSSSSSGFSKVFKKEIPVKVLTGKKTIREKCRTTFIVALEKIAVE